MVSVNRQYSEGAVKSAQWKLLLATVCALVVGSLDGVWSDSGDFAHHYALVARIFEHWQLPDVFDLSLGEMNYYPRASHQFAALVGHFFGSPMLGMQLSAIVAFAAIWVCVGLLVLHWKGWAGVAASATLVGILVVNRWLRLDLHGVEIVGNYFYAQMVAQAVALSSMVWIGHLEVRGVQAAWRHLVLLGLVYACASVHLLPALELLAFFLTVVAVDLFFHAQRSQGQWLKFAGRGLAISIVSVGLTLSHPSFSVMQDIAKNNGHIFPKGLPSIWSFLVYALVIASAAAGLLLVWFREQDAKRQSVVALKYVGAYGLAVSVLCLTQILSLSMGRGSEYAVKKHVFALHGAFMLEIAVGVGWYWFRRFGDGKGQRLESMAAIIRCVVPSVVLGLAFWSVLPVQRSHDTSALVDLETQITLRRDGEIPEVAGKYNYVAGIKDVPGSIAYAMSIGILRTARYQNSLDIFSERLPGDWSTVGSIVTSENSHLDRDPACRRAPPARALAVLDGACIAKAIQQPRRRIGFTSTDDSRGSCITSGLGSPEPFGTWFEQKQASMRCKFPLVNGKPPTQLVIDAQAFLDHVDLQRARVSVNKSGAMEFRFDNTHARQLMELPVAPTGSDEVEIQFELPDAVSPQQLGLSSDPRPLSVHIKSVEFR